MKRDRFAVGLTTKDGRGEGPEEAQEVAEAEFTATKQALKAKQKDLKQKGKSNRSQKADPLSDDDINILYDSGVLGVTPFPSVAVEHINVALNKPTHQENPAIVWDARFESSNAVDGLKSNHTWDEGQCVVSAYGKQTATWWVNLSSIHSIHHITIYFRTGNEKLGFDQPLTITVSPVYLRLKEGDQAVFRCTSSVPVPMRWSTSSNTSLPMQVSVGDTYLAIPETRISDSGSYKCFVVGEESRFFAVARLDIRSECEAYQMMCSNAKCVPISFICDGDNDCGDFSDERNCTGSTCGPDQMTCSNTKCVPTRYICDGDNDCGDFSDERNCAGSTCGPDQMTCSNTKCGPICDGDNDCGDFSDERNCDRVPSLYG
eukprot:XP_011435759.1 PREDICTED: basement membrane proteoglycan-like [Crassostrea gigas]